MDTKTLEKFCPWARNRLMEAVDLRCRRYGLTDDARAANPADSDVVSGTVLTAAEKSQRAALYARIEERGYEHFIEEMAYTWFNRFMAIRYMELRDYLPSRIRMLSCATDGSFRPDCLLVASELELPGLDGARVFDLMDAADDEGLFRLILLAQCNELADALPEVFSHLGAADELMLPDGLLRTGENDVLYHLVTDIPEETWQDVEVLGWMYQFYNSERKDDFFKSKRKASAEDLAPATQLFTPKWIVQYLVENSLGRLWMLNNPDSHLRDQMKYFIAPDDEHEDFIRINSPEDITFCDPACGSAHILSCAFDLLFSMYEERGYRPSEISRLIFEKNLTGFEIDERAAQFATFELAMCACKHDRRFLKRGVTARIHVFQSVDCEGAGLPNSISEQLEHLGEIGSLVKLTEKDLDSIHALAQEAGASLLDSKLAESLQAIEPALHAISGHYDVVVANPPYMGSSSFNPFMSNWIKKNYPDVKSDLCTCFIERSYDLADKHGYSSMVTMQSWMFLSSFEKMRNRLIDEKTIVAMAHLGPRAFDAIGGEVVSATAVVLYNSTSRLRGAYFRLVEFIGEASKENKYLDILTFGEFYSRTMEYFSDVSGSPLAYWASEKLHQLLSEKKLANLGACPEGIKTGDNERFLRFWFEVSRNATNIDAANYSYAKWQATSKAGESRKWYGSHYVVTNFEHDGLEMLKTGHASIPDRKHLYKEAISWNRIAGERLSFRYLPEGFISNMGGLCFYPVVKRDLLPILGFLNSTVCQEELKVFNPTMSFPPGTIGKIAGAKIEENQIILVESLVKKCIEASSLDWDRNELSWNYSKDSSLK